MNLKMVENAIDSLRFVIDLFYDSKYNDNENRKLKLITIFLHNSIELLIKSILINKDELCIYKDLDSNILNKAKSIQSQNKISLDEVLIKDFDIKTIGYGSIIEKYLSFYAYDKKTKVVLERLGYYRNAVTHFGLVLSDDVTELYSTIYGTIEIILYVLYPQLLTIDDYFSFNDVQDMFEPLLEVSYDIQRELCIDNKNKKILRFSDLLKETLESDKFLLAINALGVSMNIGCTDYEEADFQFDFIYITNNLVQLYSKYSYFHNVTVFYDDIGYIWFIVDHSSDNLYLYYEDERYSWCPEVYKSWINNIGTKCKSKPLTINNIRNQIIDMLKKNENIK